jgi:hypothetical protein
VLAGVAVTIIRPVEAYVASTEKLTTSVDELEERHWAVQLAHPAVTRLIGKFVVLSLKTYDAVKVSP